MTLVPTPAQIRAQVRAVWEKGGAARVIGIRAPLTVEFGDVLRVAEAELPVARCDSVLEVRERLTATAGGCAAGADHAARRERARRRRGRAARQAAPVLDRALATGQGSLPRPLRRSTPGSAPRLGRPCSVGGGARRGLPAGPERLHPGRAGLAGAVRGPARPARWRARRRGPARVEPVGRATGSGSPTSIRRRARA